MSELYREKYYATQQELISDQDRHIDDLEQLITSYQIAKDNLELRLRYAGNELHETQFPAQVY